MRRLAAPLMLATVSAIFVAPAAAPAVGSGGSVLCDPGSGELSASHGAEAAGRGGPRREPQLDQTHTDMPASAKGRARADFSATVPVYFHVITAGSAGVLTDRHIADQMAVLNETFAGREGGASAGFSFQLAAVTRTDNPAWFFAGPGGQDEKQMKAALHAGGDDALNLYTTTAGDFLGWAYLPDIVTKPGQAILDGIVIDWESLPGVSDTYEGRFDEGKTATHEVGHWLNLEHTFFGGCNAKGDFVDDTPAQRTPTSGCPVGNDTCPDKPGLDPIHNYMDYSDDPCYSEFTPGQVQRMRDAWLLYRAA
jgi:Pregnancy-associated plasma protein-A